MTANQIVRVIPVLKVNNRNVNQRFYEETLGMKVLVEEGALLSLGDASKVEKIVLEESPSMRSRKVEGPKKLGRIVVKVAQAQEIDYLLARQPETSALYQGANGRAFEVVSPQGDTIFVHAEENLESLEPLEKAPLVDVPEDFKGLTSFDVDFLEVNVADFAEAEKFYSNLPALAHFIHLQEAQGEDLQVENKVTWDLSMIKVELASFDVEVVKERLGETVDFVHRKGTFLIAKDPSQIELWFEANQDQSIFLMKNKNGVMSVNAIIEKITEQIQEGIYPGASLALYRKGQWSEHYLGLADPEKESQ